VQGRFLKHRDFLSRSIDDMLRPSGLNIATCPRHTDIIMHRHTTFVSKAARRIWRKCAPPQRPFNPGMRVFELPLASVFVIASAITMYWSALIMCSIVEPASKQHHHPSSHAFYQPPSSAFIHWFKGCRALLPRTTSTSRPLHTPSMNCVALFDHIRSRCQT